MSQNKPPSGGVSGFFTRLWHALVLYWIGMKMNLIEIFTFHKKFDLKKVPRRPGEVALITGGARGIGYEVVKKLLILDMHVVIGCRNVSAGHEALDKIRKNVTTGTSDVIKLDLMSLDSVRDFATHVSAKYSKIHILINNGGIMMVPYKTTADGNESQFQVNYLSHFLLTNLLLPKLIRAGRAGRTSRIVNVSSVAHTGGKINFDDINMQKMYSKNMGYMSSKLMQVVSTKDLNSRLEKEGLHVRVYSVHPGVVKTDLYEHVCLVKTFGFIFNLFYKTPEQGSDTIMYAGISSKFEGDGGTYFANCKKYSVNSLAKKDAVQKQLWDVSCKLTGWEDVNLIDTVKQALAGRKANPTIAQTTFTNGELQIASTSSALREELKAQANFEIIPSEVIETSDVSLSDDETPHLQKHLTNSEEQTALDKPLSKSSSRSSSSSDVSLNENDVVVVSNMASRTVEVNVEDYVTSMIATATTNATASISVPMPEIIITSFDSDVSRRESKASFKSIDSNNKHYDITEVTISDISEQIEPEFLDAIESN